MKPEFFPIGDRQADRGDGEIYDRLEKPFPVKIVDGFLANRKGKTAVLVGVSYHSNDPSDASLLVCFGSGNGWGKYGFWWLGWRDVERIDGCLML